MWCICKGIFAKLLEYDGNIAPKVIGSISIQANDFFFP
jgi:hypothetical protein